MSRALLVILFVAACGGDTQSTQQSTDDASVRNCAMVCPPCPINAQCLPGYNLSGCIAGCTTSTDCGEDEVCAIVDHYADGRAGIPEPVCVGAHVTTDCHSPSFSCSGHTDTKCLDGKRLATGFVRANNFVCGYEVTTCDGACTDGKCT